MADFGFNYVLTDEAEAALHAMFQNGSPAIQIVGFAVGTGGYSPDNVNVPLMPNSAATKLNNEIFRKLEVTYEKVSPSKSIYTGNLLPQEGIGALGEAGFFAKYIYPRIQQNGVWVDDPRTGTIFLFAILNFGMITKSSRMPLKIKLPVVI